MKRGQAHIGRVAIVSALLLLAGCSLLVDDALDAYRGGTLGVPFVGVCGCPPGTFEWVSPPPPPPGSQMATTGASSCWCAPLAPPTNLGDAGAPPPPPPLPPPPSPIDDAGAIDDAGEEDAG